MNLFTETLSLLKSNKDKRERGEFIGIPYSLPKLNKVLSGIDKGEVILLTATTGSYKSKITRFLYIYNVYKFYLETKYPIRIFYFPLENTPIDIMSHLMVYYLFDKFKIETTITKLKSIEDPLSDEIIDKLALGEKYFAKLETILTIYDNARTPQAIQDIGRRWYKVLEDTGRTDNLHSLFIIDNLQNLDYLGYKDLHTAMGDFAANIARIEFSQNFNYSCVLVQQQELSNDKQQYTNKGESIIAKIKPSVAGLATNKEVSRSAHTIIGIFVPSKYYIELYPRKDEDNSYDIRILMNYFISLCIIKQNEGEADMEIPLYFDGGIEYGEELPSYKNKDKISKWYSYVSAKRQQNMTFNFD